MKAIFSDDSSKMSKINTKLFCIKNWFVIAFPIPDIPPVIIIFREFHGFSR